MTTIEKNTQTVDQTIVGIFRDIKTKLENMFKTESVKSTDYMYGWGNVYDHTGNRAIGRKFEGIIHVTSTTKSSSPDLGSPFVRNDINVTVRDGKVYLTMTDHTDSVPVNYIDNPKDSKKNITIARAFKRKVDEKVSKLIAGSVYVLTPDQSEAFEFTNKLSIEKDRFRQDLQRTAKMLEYNGGHGVIKVKRTYFHGDVKIGGTYDSLRTYLKNNKQLVQGFNAQTYPILSQTI